MANPVIQFKRGTKAAVDEVTPVAGEPVWLTDDQGLVVGDGATAGGIHIGTKEVFDMVHAAAGGDATLAGGGVLINAVDEYGTATILIPHDFTTLVSLEVILRPAATGDDMHCDIQTFYGAYAGGEAHHAHGETADARDIGATIANQNLAHSIADLVDTAPLVAEDLLMVQVQYDATAVATNLYYRGLRLRYK